MKCALIGWGYWGKIIEKYINESNCFDLKYIYDPVVKLENSLTDIFNDKEVECVFICTPINTHYELVKMSIINGKHVFCEKPLCKDYNEVVSLSEVSKTYNKCVYTDFIYTNSKSINYMKHCISDIGKIQYIKAGIKQFGNFYKQDDVYEVIGVHILSAILYILSDLGEMELLINKNTVVLENELHLTLDGILNFNINQLIPGYIECSLVSNNKTRMIEFIGENGILRFDMLGKNTVEKILYKKELFVYTKTFEESIFFDESNNINFALLDFYNSIIKEEWNDNLNLSMKVTKILSEIKDIK